MNQSKYGCLVKDDQGKDRIKITFPYDLDLLEKIRTIPGRLWHKELYCWSAPLHEESLNMLMSFGFELSKKLQDHQNNLVLSRNKIISNGIPGLNGTLYPFQAVGTSLINDKNGCALLADDMGLGKTIQAIAYLQLHPELRPALIVCPGSIKFQWEYQLNEWLFDPKVTILEGETSYRFRGDFIIINYDILWYWYKRLQDYNFQIVIFDEAHYLKSSKAKRTKAARKTCSNIPHRIGLTGTPIENRPAEIWNIADIIQKGIFDTEWHFQGRYCDRRNGRYGLEAKGATHIDELFRILSTTIMIRRKKEDVLKDLPEKTRSFVPIELENRKEYTFAEDNFIEWVKINKGEQAAEKIANTQALSSIEALKQLAVKGKLNKAIDWIKDFLESGEKLVVFAIHHFVIDALKDEFKDIAITIDGRVKFSDREYNVRQFLTNPNIKLCIANIDAGGVGLNLISASKVAFLELPWSPGKLEQAIDRVHRIGQSQKVIAYFLLARGSVEMRIAKLLDHKLSIVKRILDGEDVEQTSLLMEIIKSYNH